MRSRRWPHAAGFLLAGGVLFSSILLSSPTAHAGPTVSPLNDPFLRGDANVDLAVNIADATTILAFLFPVGSPTPTDLANLIPCRDAADTNDDEGLDIGDAVYLLAYLFSEGPEPAAPFGMCGDDPTETVVPGLTCLNYPTCLDSQDPNVVGHVLRRVAFGHTPELFETVLQTGAEQYVLDQLNGVYDDNEPGNVNQELFDLLATQDWETTGSISSLQRSLMARAILTREQLREQMTDFWDVHFSTYVFTVRAFFRDLPEYNNTTGLELATRLEGAENQLFRDGAFGSFYDLLLESASGVPMVIYLDSYLNIAAEPNENYAREILELHSLGVDNIYNQDDIEELARCFTGWTLCKKDPAIVNNPASTIYDIAQAPCLPNNDPTGVWAFHFDTSVHDYAQKVIFASNPTYTLTIPARTPGSIDGLDDALDVIAQLAGMAPTAEFVSRKLIQKFLRDGAAPGSLVSECISVWGPDGDIAAVLEVILTSDEFLMQGGSDKWNLIETPYEYAMGNARALWTGSLDANDKTTMLNNIRNMMSRTGNLPFYWSTPDGYPNSGPDQLGTSKLLERIQLNSRLFDNASMNPGFDIEGHLLDNGIALDDVTAIVDFLLAEFYQGNTNAVDRQLSIEFLESDGNGVVTPLDPMAGDYDTRLRQFVIFVASFPQSAKQ